MQRALATYLFLLLATPAFARDYDRNDLAERELSLGFGLSPMDMDTRIPQTCPNNPMVLCALNVARTEAVTVRASARRHMRFLYLGVEGQVGASLPTAVSSTQPWLAAGATIGLETSNNGWDRWRGYGELAVLAIWANTRLAETLNFAGEFGVRYHLDSSSRPHTLLHLGVRAMYNFDLVGVMSYAGVSWTFD